MMRESDSIRKFATGVINDEKSLATLAVADQGSENSSPSALSRARRRCWIFFALG